MRSYLLVHVALLAVLAVVVVTGCVSPSGNPSLVQVGTTLTNATPLLTAVAGAAAVNPATAPIAPLIGAAAALLAALGGWMARHYAVPAPPVPPPQPVPPSPPAVVKA